jgi:hypothetical protein
MARVRYIGDEPRAVSILPEGRVQHLDPDELFEVGDDYVDSYTCQPHLYQIEETLKGKK